MARKRQERFERFVKSRQLELENFEDKEEDWDKEVEKETDSTEIELELQPRDIPQILEQRKEDDEKMLTETTIIHRNNSEIISREEVEDNLTFLQKETTLLKHSEKTRKRKER